MVAPSAVLALVLARGGSKSIPRKNLREVGGVPLVAYPVAAALRAKTVGRVIVSTDDEGIAEVARAYGAEVPFLRPPELAQDDTPDLPVFVHALTLLEQEEGARPEIIVHLRPTTPFCRSEDIDRGVELLASRPEADAVRMVCRPSQNPFKMWQKREDGFLMPLVDVGIPEPYNQPRQKLPPVFWQNGVDFTRWRTVISQGSMTGRRILALESSASDWENWVDIDSEVTLESADFLVRTGRIQIPCPVPIRPRLEGGAGNPRRRTWPVHVKLLALDFDGVMTDNRVWVSREGEELVAVNRSDGMGLRLLQEHGVEVVVLSSEESELVASRCRKLDLRWYMGAKDKLPVLLGFLADRGIAPEETIYVGNDINDLPCMEAVGFGVAVQDAHPEVLHHADRILGSPGGRGAVREICDLILRHFGTSENQ